MRPNKKESLLLALVLLGGCRSATPCGGEPSPPEAAEAAEKAKAEPDAPAPAPADVAPSPATKD